MAEPPADPSKLRVSDAEREAVVSLLQRAASEGRLTLGEFGERTEAVYGSLTRGDLEKVTEDLPVPARTADADVRADAHVGIGRRSDAAETDKGRRITAIMGDHEDRLVGTISENQRVLAIMGDVTLDLRDAVLPGGRVTITGHVVMGSVRIVVPDGIEVRSGGSNVMGDVKTRVNRGQAGRGPVVRVNLVNIMGEVRILDDAHHNKRSRWSRWWGGD